MNQQKFNIYNIPIVGSNIPFSIQKCEYRNKISISNHIRNHIQRKHDIKVNIQEEEIEFMFLY